MACFLVLWLESPGFSFLALQQSSLLQDCLNYSRKEQGKKKKAKQYRNKKGLFPTLTPRGPLPFLVHIPEKDLSKSSVCVQFLAAFETTPGDTKREKRNKLMDISVMF